MSHVPQRSKKEFKSFLFPDIRKGIGVFFTKAEASSVRSTITALLSSTCLMICSVRALPRGQGRLHCTDCTTCVPLVLHRAGTARPSARSGLRTIKLLLYQLYRLDLTFFLDRPRTVVRFSCSNFLF